jgi:hypothetical protein
LRLINKIKYGCGDIRSASKIKSRSRDLPATPIQLKNKCTFEIHPFYNLVFTIVVSRITISVCLITAPPTCPGKFNVGLSSPKCFTYLLNNSLYNCR